VSGSLRRRLVLAACAWVLALTALGGLALSLAFRSAVTRAFDADLAEQARQLLASVETARDGSWWLRRRPDDARFESIYSGRYWQLGDGRHAEHSRSLWDAALPAPAALAPGQAVFADVQGPGGQALRGVQLRALLPDLAQPLDIQVADSTGVLDAEAARFNQLLALALAVLAGGLVLAVWLQVGFGLRPLRRLAGEVREVREGRREAIAPGHPSEVQPLVDELDAVLGHNRRLLERARSSSADLAHALKTPLTVMAAELHAPGTDWREVMAAQLAHTRALIDRHLARAAIAGAGPGRRTPVRPVLEAVLAAMRRIHADRGLAFGLEVHDAAVFAGDRQDLEEALGNLLDNAGKWARARVDVAVAVDAGAGRLRIDVDDDGPGLTAGERDQAAARGRRFDQQVPGSGLGLAIVEDIATSHGGGVELADSPLGGLRARLDLPAAAR
jgi:signal transduction histidine kinase